MICRAHQVINLDIWMCIVHALVQNVMTKILTVIVQLVMEGYKWHFNETEYASYLDAECAHSFNEMSKFSLLLFSWWWRGTSGTSMRPCSQCGALPTTATGCLDNIGYVLSLKVGLATLLAVAPNYCYRLAQYIGYSLWWSWVATLLAVASIYCERCGNVAAILELDEHLQVRE